MKRTSAFTAAMTSVGVALFFPIVTRADPFVWGKTPTSIVTGRYSHGARPSFRIPWATPCLQYRRSESLQSVAIISDFPPQAESWRPQSILSKPGGVYEARAKIQTFGGRKEKDVTPQRSYLLGTTMQIAAFRICGPRLWQSKFSTTRASASVLDYQCITS